MPRLGSTVIFSNIRLGVGLPTTSLPPILHPAGWRAVVEGPATAAAQLPGGSRSFVTAHHLGNTAQVPPAACSPFGNARKVSLASISA